MLGPPHQPEGLRKKTVAAKSFGAHAWGPANLFRAGPHSSGARHRRKKTFGRFGWAAGRLLTPPGRWALSGLLYDLAGGGTGVITPFLAFPHGGRHQGPGGKGGVGGPIILLGPSFCGVHERFHWGAWP